MLPRPIAYADVGRGTAAPTKLHSIFFDSNFVLESAFYKGIDLLNC